MADRQLAEQLSRLIPVLYVEPATSIVSRFRERGWRGIRLSRRLQRVSPELARCPEGLPGLTWRGHSISEFLARFLAGQVGGKEVQRNRQT